MKSASTNEGLTARMGRGPAARPRPPGPVFGARGDPPMTTLQNPIRDGLAVVPSDVASLALPFLVATQTAALACLGFIGRGDPKAADGAAVAALRDALARLPGRARVVIGEGEKDDAPMLFAGEELGT